MFVTTLVRRTVLGILLAAATAQASHGVYQQLLKSSAMIITPDGNGSGALVDSERRLIFTNYHVVGQLEEVDVLFPQYDGEQLITSRSDMAGRMEQDPIKGRVVARDMRRDLALIEIEEIPEGVEAIELAATSASPGEQVHSIGNPGASNALWIYTSGTVRQVYRKQHRISGEEGTAVQSVDAYVLETQSPINPGDSGGPVVNNACQVVGIVSSSSREGNLVSTCIDVRELKSLLEGENRTVNMPLKEMLDAASYRYEFKDNGDFFVDVPSSGDRTIRVEIDSEIYTYQGRRIRHIRALLVTLEDGLAPEAALKLMIENGDRTFGNWEVWNLDDGHYVFFRTDVDADASADTVQAMLLGVARVTQETIDRLNSGGEDTPTAPVADADQDGPASPLTGTWAGSFEQNGQRLGIAVTFTVDGEILWYVSDGKEELFRLEGTFELAGDQLTYGDGQQKFGAVLKVLDENTISYEDVNIALTLERHVEK